MKIGNHVDKYHTFIDTQLNPDTRQPFVAPRLRPAVTLSRQTGSGGRAIAEELATFLQARSPSRCPWMVFDRNLTEKVLEEHKLPKEIAKFMPEDCVSSIQDAIEEILGLHPSSRTLVQQTSETLRHLAELGHVILVGRGSHVITRGMKNVFHIRLIAPLEQRVARIMTRNQLDETAARQFIRKQDLGRKRYLKNHFHTHIDDNLQYDLVINTASLPHRAVAQLIGEAILQWAEAL
jgi:cytidylate kinase